MIRPDLKQWSATELAIIFSSAFMGLILRIAFPDLVGLASDEIASLFYSQHAALIFRMETHPPFYYLFLKLFSWLDPYALRTLMGAMSFGLILYSLFLSLEILPRRGTCLLAALLFLSPVDIFFARTIRQYSLLLELSVILILLGQTQGRKPLKAFVSFFISGIHPLGWITPFCIGLRNIKKGAVYFLSITPVFIYYGLKWVTSGKNGIIGDFIVRGKKAFSFPIDILNTFSGEHFPRINYVPIPETVKLITAGCFLCVLVYGAYIGFIRKASVRFLPELLITFFVSILFIEGFSLFVADIRNARYLIFLLAPIYLFCADTLSRIKWSETVLMAVLVFNLLMIEPLRAYHCERESYGFYKEIQNRDAGVELILCGNIYHAWFYTGKEHVNCDEVFRKLARSEKRIVVVDLNGMGTTYIFSHKDEFDVFEHRFNGYTRAYYLGFKNPSKETP